MSDPVESSAPVEPQETPAIKTDEDNAPKGGGYYKVQANQLKMKASELERTNLELQKRLSEIEDQNLRQTNQWQELANKYKTEKEQLEKQHTDFKSYFVQEKKLETLKREAMKAGIREEAIHDLDLVDSSMVQIETTSTGKINILNADEFVQSLKSQRPYWFRDSNPPKMNTTNPSETPPKQLTPNDILQLQKTNPAEYQKTVLKLASERNKK